MADDQLAGRVALVTGSAKRVGREIALRLAREGADVIIHYNLSSGEAEDVRRQIEGLGRQAWVVQADLAEPDSCRGLIAEAVRLAGGIDVLVNNASAYEPTPIGMPADAWADVWLQQFRVNTLAPAVLSHAAAATLRERRGAIVNLVDICWDHPWKDFAAYSASKAALANLTLALARELAPDVRVNGVAPGVAVFPDDLPEAERKQYRRRIPLARDGTPTDMADAVVFLATQAYTTGVILPVDGGRRLT